ncbi:translation initiation factor IF-2-like [Vulpes lagopus]|uniref:translation initiation factor IF-2-like n=1 Tax=Vulpes lagopus TaxID=494514 RepID=UPI001BCA3509|nr:translation initiation factor IF-2-like [Vulpes lagopus]XP_041600373.1 translation initiation factor IF-2-like [Vulpes lagopus]
MLMLGQENAAPTPPVPSCPLLRPGAQPSAAPLHRAPGPAQPSPAQPSPAQLLHRPAACIQAPAQGSTHPEIPDYNSQKSTPQPARRRRLARCAIHQPPTTGRRLLTARHGQSRERGGGSSPSRSDAWSAGVAGRPRSRFFGELRRVSGRRVDGPALRGVTPGVEAPFCPEDSGVRSAGCCPRRQAQAAFAPSPSLIGSPGTRGGKEAWPSRLRRAACGRRG